MTAQQMLRELGYVTSTSGISSFQRDYNLLGSAPVLVTGKLDEDTQAAVRFAYGARVAFRGIRDRKKVDRG